MDFLSPRTNFPQISPYLRIVGPPFLDELVADDNGAGRDSPVLQMGGLN